MYKHLEDTFENQYGTWTVTVYFDRPYTDKRIVERIVRVETGWDEMERVGRYVGHTEAVKLHKRKFLRGVVRDPQAPDLAEHIELAVKEAIKKYESLLERDSRTLADVGVDL